MSVQLPLGMVSACSLILSHALTGGLHVPPAIASIPRFDFLLTLVSAPERSQESLLLPLFDVSLDLDRETIGKAACLFSCSLRRCSS